MSFYLIGLSGKKQHGKNTCAKIIEEICAKKYITKQLAFADSLKEEVARAVGYNVSYIEQHKSDFRTILQWWGTEFRRKHCQNDNYWCEELLSKLWKMDSKVTLVVITDVRFKNEYELIRKLGGHLWRVVRPEISLNKDTHSSETALDNEQFDCIISNQNDLDYLKIQTNIALIKSKLI